MQEPETPQPYPPPRLPFTVEDIEPVAHTVRFNPLRTTLRMERVYWDELDRILEQARLTRGEFLAELVTRMNVSAMPNMNVAAAVRVFVLTAARDGDPFRPRNQA